MARLARGYGRAEATAAPMHQERRFGPWRRLSEDVGSAPLRLEFDHSAAATQDCACPPRAT
jgi:hypothetical protein